MIRQDSLEKERQYDISAQAEIFNEDDSKKIHYAYHLKSTRIQNRHSRSWFIRAHYSE